MRRWSLVFALLATVVMAFLVVQQHLGLGISRVTPLNVEDFEADGLSWRASLPRALRDDQVVAVRLVMLEDGVPIGVRGSSNKEVRELGRGRFFVRGNSLRLAPFDQSDPQTNGRSYAVRYPARVPAWALATGWALMLAAWAWALAVVRRVQVEPPSDKTPNGRGPAGAGRFRGLWDKGPSLCVLGACALVVATLWAWDRPFSDGAFSIKGMPYSDAFGWNLMAEQIAAGDPVTAFPGQRRFFPWLLAGVYAWTGSSITVATMVQMAFTTGIGVLVYALCLPLARSRWIAAAAALATVSSPLLRHMVHIPMTEPCGLVFTLAGILLLWQGMVRRKLWMIIGAGVFYALSNLASPFSFLAAPFYALTLLFHDWRIEAGWWRRLRGTVLLTIVVIAVYVPWLAFQKQAVGAFTFSSNSAGLLYGAVSEDGGWGPSMFAEAEEAGFAEYSAARDAFFMRRFKETVAEDPMGYVRLIARRSHEFTNAIERMDPAAPALAILGLLAMAATLARNRLALWPLVCWPPLAWLALWSHHLSPAILIPACAIVLAILARGRNRVPLALLLSTALAVTVINGMTGNLMPRRGWVFFDWLLLTLWLSALAQLLSAASGWMETLWRRVMAASGGEAAPAPGIGTGTESPDHLVRMPTGAVIVLSALVAWAGVSAVKLSHRKITGPLTPGFVWEDSLPQEILTAAGAPPQAVARLIILTDHQAELAAGEEIVHYSRAFDRHDRTVTVVRPIVPRPDSISRRGSLVRFAGSLESLARHQPFMLVALESFDDSRFIGDRWLDEALALVPLVTDKDGRLQPDLSSALRFEPLEPAAPFGRSGERTGPDAMPMPPQ